MIPLFGHLRIDSSGTVSGESQKVLPRLEHIMDKKLFKYEKNQVCSGFFYYFFERNCTDPVGDLSSYMRHRLLKRSSNSSNESFVRDRFGEDKRNGKIESALTEDLNSSRGPIGSAAQLEEVADPPEELVIEICGNEYL